MSSDDDFDDDDDVLLRALVAGEGRLHGATEAPSLPPDSDRKPPLAALSSQARLYKAEGEVSILRAQLQQMEHASRAEVARLRENLAAEKQNSDSQVTLLRAAVLLLEDERKFLNNELQAASGALKRRKVADSVPRSGRDSAAFSGTGALATPPTQPRRAVPPAPLETRPVVLRVIRVDNDASLLEDHLWTHCINGCHRTTLSFLAKIYLPRNVSAEGLFVPERQPVASAVVEFLMSRKSLRLDVLLDQFCLSVCDLADEVVRHCDVTSVPFLLALVHSALTFRSSALSEESLRKIASKVARIAGRFVHLLDTGRGHDLDHHTRQLLVLQRFALVCCFDILERVFYVATAFPDLPTALFRDNMADLFRVALPENSERFVSTTQVNLVHCVVEMLIASVGEQGFAFGNQPIADAAVVSSLLKVLLIDIPIKDDFMFHGLNRTLGNNGDLQKVEATVPESTTQLDEMLVLLPCPFPSTLSQPPQDAIDTSHEHHLLSLRLRVATMIEGHIVAQETTQVFQNKEFLKSMVRYIGLEQGVIMNCPRSPTVYLRVQTISTLVRVLHYISTEVKTIASVVYPETMYEVFVILLRIAFGSDSMSVDAYRLLSHGRQAGYFGPIYNHWCEQRARQLGHSDSGHPQEMADLESEFANGLEFPYEQEIIELAREILEPCVTHEEADNLYFNLNYEEPRFDEMDLVT